MYAFVFNDYFSFDYLKNITTASVEAKRGTENILKHTEAKHKQYREK